MRPEGTDGRNVPAPSGRNLPWCDPLCLPRGIRYASAYRGHRLKTTTGVFGRVKLRKARSTCTKGTTPGSPDSSVTRGQTMGRSERRRPKRTPYGSHTGRLGSESYFGTIGPSADSASWWRNNWNAVAQRGPAARRHGEPVARNLYTAQAQFGDNRTRTTLTRMKLKGSRDNAAETGAERHPLQLSATPGALITAGCQLSTRSQLAGQLTGGHLTE